MSRSKKSQEVIKKIADSNRIIVCLPEISDDNIAFVEGVCEILSDGGRKVVDLALSDESSYSLSPKLQNLGVNIVNKLLVGTYKVIINYGDADIDKVAWDLDEENNQLIYLITTRSGEFDFSNIQYEENASGYDIALLIDVQSYSQLGTLYQQNKKFFKQTPVVAVGDVGGRIGQARYKTHDPVDRVSFLISLSKAFDYQPETLIRNYLQTIDLNTIKSDKKKYAQLLTEMLDAGLDPVEILTSKTNIVPKVTDKVTETAEELHNRSESGNESEQQSKTENSAEQDHVHTKKANVPKKLSISKLTELIKKRLMRSEHGEVITAQVSDAEIDKLTNGAGSGAKKQALQDMASEVLSSFGNNAVLFFLTVVRKTHPQTKKPLNVDVYAYSADPEKVDADLVAQVFDGGGSLEAAKFTLTRISKEPPIHELDGVLSDLYSIDVGEYAPVG